MAGTSVRQTKWLVGAFFFVLVVDQITKALVMANIEPGTPFRDNTFFYLSHQRNDGLVGGIFGGVLWLSFAAPVFATGILIYLFRHLDRDSRWQTVAYGMVLGGALGNFIDRVRYQSVTDFLQFHFYFIPFDFPWKIYPAFNVADMGIFVGVAILVVSWGSEVRDDVPSTA